MNNAVFHGLICCGLANPIRCALVTRCGSEGLVNDPTFSSNIFIQYFIQHLILYSVLGWSNDPTPTRNFRQHLTAARPWSLGRIGARVL